MITVLSVLGLFLSLLSLYIQHLKRTRQVIEDADGNPYLIRYFIWKPDWLQRLGIDPKKAGRIYLHHIIRPDYDRALHDHPWSFVSIILKGGYYEWTKLVLHYTVGNKPVRIEQDQFRWYGPGRILYRPSPSPHRLELPEGKDAWSLVFIGPKKNEWGFYTAWNKWCHWKKYDFRRGICEEPETEREIG